MIRPVFDFIFVKVTCAALCMHRGRAEKKGKTPPRRGAQRTGHHADPRSAARVHSDARPRLRRLRRGIGRRARPHHDWSSRAGYTAVAALRRTLRVRDVLLCTVPHYLASRARRRIGLAAVQPRCRRWLAIASPAFHSSGYHGGWLRADAGGARQRHGHGTGRRRWSTTASSPSRRSASRWTREVDGCQGEWSDF